MLLPVLSLMLTLLHAPLAEAQESAAGLPEPLSRPVQAAPAGPLTLADCYRMALARSETIALQRELIVQTEARLRQALSGALPRASFQYSNRRQDGTGSSNFTLREIPESKFVVTQPLFSGFREFAATQAARHEKRQRRHEQARAEHLLMVDVANAFFLVREQREDLIALETTRSILMARLDELAERERLGRTRPTELASVEAQLRRVEADWVSAAAREAAARQLLEFLVGAPVEAVLDLPAAVPPVEPESAYLSRVAQRPDVWAAAEALRSAGKGVGVARADFWPDVDLEGNYYTERVGNAADVKWDVMLLVDVPLFQGGEAAAAHREAKSLERQAQLSYERLVREATLDVRDKYTQFLSAVARANALRQAVTAAETHYRLQAEDYSRSLVDNLEVLRALEDLQEARRQLIAATHETKRLYWQLQAAVGRTVASS
jgi:outer membrane protein